MYKMAKDTKNINIEVPIYVWKEIKKISIDKEITMQEATREILEEVIKKK